MLQVFRCIHVNKHVHVYHTRHQSWAQNWEILKIRAREWRWCTQPRCCRNFEFNLTFLANKMHYKYTGRSRGWVQRILLKFSFYTKFLIKIRADFRILKKNWILNSLSFTAICILCKSMLISLNIKASLQVNA